MSHRLTGIAATYVIDENATSQYEQVVADPGDRTYGNGVRCFIRGDFETPLA